MTAAAELLEDHDAVTVVAAAIKMATKEPDDTPVRLTDEAPMVTATAMTISKQTADMMIS